MCVCLWVCAWSVVSDSFVTSWTVARLPCPWNFLSKNTTLGFHFLLQWIFPTKGSNLLFLCLLYWQVNSSPLALPGKSKSKTINLFGWLESTQCSQPCSRPPPTQASARDSQTLTGKSGLVSCGITDPFSWVLVSTRFCLCPPNIYAGHGVWCQMWFHPFYHLDGASPLPLDMGYLFLMRFNILLLMVVQQWVVILEFSWEKRSAHPSTPPSRLFLVSVYKRANTLGFQKNP